MNRYEHITVMRWPVWPQHHLVGAVEAEGAANLAQLTAGEAVAGAEPA